MNKQHFGQSIFLTKFSFRRDWIKLSLWLISLVLFFSVVAFIYPTLYDTQNSIDSIVETLKAPAMTALFGKMPAGPNTIAKILASEMTVFMAMISDIMSFSFIIKNTRNEEDSGLTEMIQAHAVGKLSPLMAAVIEVISLNLAIGLLYGISLSVANLDGASLNGNFLIGISISLFGVMFASFAALIAQLVDNARMAAILSYLLFGILYIARMSTDIAHPRLTWWIPFGWIEKISAYHDNNWLPVILMLTVSVIVLILAFSINLKRDGGAGIIATKPGRKSASPFLNGTFTLFFRLHRTSIIAWILGLMILGFTYGSIFDSIGDILKTNPTMASLFDPGMIKDANNRIIKEFVSILMIVFGVLASIPGIQIINYLKTGEAKGYLEMIHARSVSRTRLFFNIFILAILTSFLALFTSMWGLQLGGVYSMTHPLSLSLFLRGFYAYLSPIFIILSLTICLVSWLPKLSGLSYLYLVFAFFVQYFHKLLKLPDWLEKFSPFGYIPKVPLHTLDVGTFWWQMFIGLCLIVIAYIGYRSRDLKNDQ